MSLETSQPVRLKCEGIVTWVDGRPSWIDQKDLRAHHVGKPTWVQLALPWLSPFEQSWFEGSVDPWDDPDAPEIDWSGVDGVLDTVGIGRATLERADRDLLERLPDLYGRGVARVAREVWGPDAGTDISLRFFPTVAFRPIKGSDPPRFWIVRATVGVIGDVVVTVRLPDLHTSDEQGVFDYEPRGRLEVARRYFAVADDLTADDVAEAIGLQQASTARAVSELVRSRLTHIERESRAESRRKRKAELEDTRRVIEMTDTLHQLDRQLERLLRRVELNASDVIGRSGTSDIAVRYRFALDELRSLEGNGRLASQAITQAERERFERVGATLASVILVPTLLASIYGANVKLPARDTWGGFALLIVAIVALAALGLFLVRRWLPRRTTSAAPSQDGFPAQPRAPRHGLRRRLLGAT
jgi:CorA-like Mg2+ transporter protein